MITYCNKKDIEPFYTIVLAIKSCGSKSLVCFYDPHDNRIKIERLRQKSNNYENIAFYLIPSDGDAFIASGQWEGFDWIIDKIPRLYPQRKKFDETTTQTAKELYKTINIPEWFEVLDTKSGNNLLDIAGYFHDSYIYSISDIKDGKRIIFDSTWGFYIVLDCEGIELDVLNELSKVEFFIDADINVLNEGIFLTLYKVIENIENAEIVIKCKKMKGKLIISKLTRKDKKNKKKEVLVI